MAVDSTKLIIDIESRLRNLERTLKGLAAIRKSLQSVANVSQQVAGVNRASAATDRLSRQQQRAAITAQRLANQEQAVNVRALELSNRMERARQATQRLAQSQQRLDAATAASTSRLGQQADAHVRFFKATEAALKKAPLADSHVQAFRSIEKAAKDADTALKKAPQMDAHVRAFRALERGAQDADSHVKAFRASERALARAPQLDSHVRAFRALQKGVEDADHHVQFFRANEAALAKAPQMDAHVRAFRALEAASKQASQGLLGIGNALRGLGQGLVSLGATLSVTITAPLVAAGAASVDAAMRLDSLKRGLAAIVGSADEANRQLQRLTQIAKLPGIGFEEAIQGSIRLQAVGFSAAEAEKSLREFANAVALTGGGREELTRVTVQLGQLAAKGKVLSQDLRPIIEAAPAVGRALLEAFGTVNPDDIGDLGISSQQFLSILTEQLTRLPRAAAGAKNSFENFRDEVFRAAAAVGEVLLPGLVRLAEVVGPIITRLAEIFTQLPRPVQLVGIGLATLAAALGPVLFVVGQLTIGVGRLLVEFVELNAAGILPTIISLRGLTAASLTAAAAQRTLGVSSLALGGAIGGIAAILAAIAAAYVTYNAFQKDATTLSKERAEQLTAEIDGLEKQAKFLNGLGAGVERTADEQQRLSDIYDKLNSQAQIRVAGITDEAKRLIALRAELEKVIQLRGQERDQQAASVAAQIANSAAQIASNDAGRQSITANIAANNELVETLQREGRITDDTRRKLEQLGHSTSVDVVRAVENLQQQSARLVQRQRELGENTQEVRGQLNDYLTTLRTLDPQHQLTARQLLTLAKNLGLFRGDIEQTVPILEKYIQTVEKAAAAQESLIRPLSGVAQSLLKSGDAADKAAKARRALIEAAAAQAREISVDFEGALRDIKRTVDAVPELRQALEREKELTGKSLEELLREALESAFKGRAKDKSGTALRNAQEQLAQALADVAQASAEELGQIEQLKNDALLQENENAFKLQLVAYRQYLNERARLTSANLQLEINAQRALITQAEEEQKRFRERAAIPNLPAAERVKAQGSAAAAEERIIKARTKILDLQQKQRDANVELDQALRESAKQQLDDVRKLEIEFGELQGRIEDAANATTDEKFRESLQALSAAQDDLNKRLLIFGKLLSADERQALEAARAQNQRQIDAIENIKAQEDALAALAAANELVRRAKERQAKLEDDLTFQTESRGLTEEAAIKRRLAGEEKLNDSLIIAHETIRQIVAALQARGVEPPRALIEFLQQLRTEVQGLGELSFSEQFRLAQKEFDRINDERLQKIADVERAVRNRDIAEAEGLLLIRRINGQYVGDLERQLEVLKQIAAASGDVTLKRQAADAAETAKDAADQLAKLTVQIRSTSIDALQEGFTNFFTDLADRSQSATQDLLKFINSVVGRVEQVIAENLSRKLIESIFGTGDGKAGDGIIAGIRRLFGLGGKVTTTVAEAAPHAAEATAHAAETAAITTASAALTTAGATAGTAITVAATAFASTVTAAAAAFASIVTAAAGTQAAGGLGTLLGGAETGLYPAVPGGVYRVVEGGYPEAVLTTDPQHAVRQVSILREFLARTKGLGGRIPGFEVGAMVSRETGQANLLSAIHRAAPMSLPLADAASTSAGPNSFTFRQILVDDQRDISNWYNSAEGDRVQVQWLARNRPTVRKLLGIREGN